MSEVIVTLDIDDAIAFLRALSPFDDRWLQTGGQECWIFRGQSNAAWELNPSAMRPSGFHRVFIGSRQAISIASWDGQLHIEQMAVFEFINHCLGANLPIPEDSQWIRSREILEAAFEKTYLEHVRQGAGWPLGIHRSLYALAQHHGIPTRLLDWTSNPLVAAYFACREVAEELAKPVQQRKPNLGERFTVYAFRRIAFDIVAREPEFEPIIEEVEAPYANNPNLRAQKGKFTVVTYRTPDAAKKSHLLPSMEQVLTRWVADQSRSEQENFPFLIKFTLPVRCAGTVLRRLWQVGVWAGTIYPNYDAVVKGIHEVQYHAE